MPASASTTFLRKLGGALQEWAEEVAVTADPELVNMPLMWTIDRNEIRGCPPSICSPSETSVRLARWAKALGLTSNDKADTRSVTYVGRVDLWPVRLDGTIGIRSF